VLPRHLCEQSVVGFASLRNAIYLKEHLNMSTTTQELKGKVAVITEGTSGSGLATGHRFAAYVFITGRRKDALDLP